jgi:hypothetical protein
MGQAKQRGTFDERAERSKIEHTARLERPRLVELERERNMTPEDRARRRKAQGLLAIATGLTLGFPTTFKRPRL